MPATDAGTLKRWRSRCGELSPDDLAAAALLARELRLAPLVAGLLVQRGQRDVDTAGRFLSPQLTDLHDPALLPGCDAAAKLIDEAVRQERPIVVYGDYDVDGITASAILWHTLTLARAKVTTYVPHRIEEGYGLNTEAMKRLAAQVDGKGQRPLIVSVDCGITAVEPVAAAVAAGATVVVTDHHEFDCNALPTAAAALVHPRLPTADGSSGGAYPFPDLCGAGVAFKLAWHFARVHCNSERVPAVFRDLLVDLLALAALGTVADMVPLVGENRIIAAHGLRRVKHTRFVGLNALIDAAALRDEKIDAYHVGFTLGPRLNACGRMGHAKRAVHLLTEAQHNEAIQVATFLTEENNNRRKVERQVFEQAAAMVEERGWDAPDQRALVVGAPGWHAGVVGIVAGRMVERFCRPVVMLNLDNGEAHGSARSVPGVSIHEALCACAGHLTRFGGHAMAAGLHLPTDAVDAFRAALVAFVNEKLDEDALRPCVAFDADCEVGAMQLPLFEQVHRLEPFGRGNEAPLLRVAGARLPQAAQRMGQHGRHLRLTLQGGGRYIRAVAFGMGDLAPQLAAGVTVEAVAEPRISTWNGQRYGELHVRDLRPVSG